ncbi:hypothetical protein HD553DRAFT_7966 [Filobasidium floriforme]|jgi:hypothetical protein|uniref:uncharacterized protein n=1 Tax=Filobasidium floriforme TaxID=5210 RepID=UPI001E8CEDC1|nr:uncharacterized protein HD553DRAFT_7966 [Filobasidium floriforme]KAH8090530.1 hypothetical protein HD553DRAFT_7966 [Filobasidium floriforme]
MPRSNLAFYLHGLLAIPPFFNFFALSFNPDRLARSQTGHILRNYAFLLLSTSVVTFVHLANQTLGVEQRVKDGRMALALSIYHVAPIWRAIARITGGEAVWTKEMGGPGVHLGTHLVVMAVLLKKGLMMD